MTTRSEILVLGGGYAGVMAALRLGWQTRSLGARVTLVSASPTLVERIRLHETAAGRPVRAHPLAPWLDGAGVRLRLARAEGIDVTAQRLALERGGAVAYDLLVYAAGSEVAPGVPGTREHAFGLSVEGAQEIAARLAARDHPDGVVVAGGGLTAIEAASELAEKYPLLRVTLVAPRLADGFSGEAQRYLREALRRLGVNVVEGEAVAEVEPCAVRLASGSRLQALCVWAAGLRASPLAEQSGLNVNRLGQLAVDGSLRAVGAPAVVAAGDVAAPPSHRGAPVPMGCKSALPMGAHAAEVVAALLRGDTAPGFSYGGTPFCVSIGRRDGLVEYRDEEGRHTGRLITGRAGAAVKELICRSTVWSLTAESLCPGWWRWPEPGSAVSAGATRAA